MNQTTFFGVEKCTLERSLAWFLSPLSLACMPIVRALQIRSAGANPAATGFHGMGLITDPVIRPDQPLYQFGYFPLISNDGVFDFVKTPPPGTLSYHPGTTGVVPGVTSANPGVVVTRFEASAPLRDVILEFSFSTPQADSLGFFPRGVAIDILDGVGVLFSAGVTTAFDTVYSGSVPLGDMSVGEHFFVVISNGGFNDAFGDQTFVSLRITQVIPEPSAAWLSCLGLIAVASPHWFKVQLSMWFHWLEWHCQFAKHRRRYVHLFFGRPK